jgi:hypothetical protein
MLSNFRAAAMIRRARMLRSMVRKGGRKGGRDQWFGLLKFSHSLPPSVPPSRSTGQPTGAASFALLSCLRANPKQNYTELLQNMRKTLAGRYLDPPSLPPFLPPSLLPSLPPSLLYFPFLKHLRGHWPTSHIPEVHSYSPLFCPPSLPPSLPPSGKYTQVPQLSTAHPIDLNVPFAM